MAKKTEKKTDKKIAKKTSSTKPKQKRQTTKHSVYVLIDKHEGVGEQYYEYLISKSDFEEVKDTIGILVPVEYRKLLSKLEQISPDYPYYEEGLKEGSLNIYEVPDEDAEIDPFRPPLFSTVASPSDWSEKDFELTPNDDQVVVEIVRTMGRYEVNTYFSGSPTSIDLESGIRDYDDDNYEESMTYEMCEKLNVRHSPVRGLTTDIESECLAQGMNLFCSDQCSDLEREYDAYYDTIEVYVRDSSGNRTKLTSNTKPKQKIRKPKSDVVLDAALFFFDAGTDSDGDDASTKTRSKITPKKPGKKTDKKIAKKSSDTKPKQKIGKPKSKAEVRVKTSKK